MRVQMHKGFGDTERLSRVTILHALSDSRKKFSLTLWCELADVARVATRRHAVEAVFGVCHPLKICRSVVQFVVVDMIDEIRTLLRFAERQRDKTVNHNGLTASAEFEFNLRVSGISYGRSTNAAFVVVDPQFPVRAKLFDAAVKRAHAAKITDLVVLITGGGAPIFHDYLSVCPIKSHYN